MGVSDKTEHQPWNRRLTQRHGGGSWSALQLAHVLRSEAALVHRKG